MAAKIAGIFGKMAVNFSQNSGLNFANDYYETRTI